MTKLLDEMELVLSDLAQSGFSTGAHSCSRRFGELSEKFGAGGFHTAAAIAADISRMLSQRPHQPEKDDGPLMEQICMAVRYVELAREKLTQQSILDRWDETCCRKQGGKP